MKILALTPVAIIFPMAYHASGSTLRCRRRGGICRFGNCLFPERHIGRCSSFQPCCSR
uniref:Beta-defensin-like domain-containing protein n=1 Tax=Anas zonorhyncha TaxID=75864 RepID=A0A8B9ZWZ2_9AVES